MSNDTSSRLQTPIAGSPRARSGVALNERQRRFVQEYLKCPVAVQAAVHAGYSARTAEWIGPQLLKKPHIATAVRVAQADRAERVGIDADRVLDEIARIALADPRRIVDGEGKLIPLHKLPAEVASALASIEALPNGGVKYRFWDKNTALEKLMKHLGLFERDNRQKGDELGRLLAFLDERQSRFQTRR